MTDAFFEGSPTQRDYQRVFYAVLLGAALVHRVSPLSAAYRAAELPSPLFTPPPIVARLARLFSSGRRIPEVLLVAKATVLACWAVCIADVSGSAWPRVALFAGMCVLQATTRACSCSHSWHVVLGVLYALCFDGTAPELGGFGRRLAQFVVAHALASSGVTKLRTSGPAWAHGDTLRFYLRLFAASGNTRWPALSSALASQRLAPPALACATLALELSAPVAMTLPALRAPYLAIAASFHFGVWLTMKPAYYPQAWCYALLLAPRAVAAAGDGGGGGAGDGAIGERTGTLLPADDAERLLVLRRAALVLGAAFVAALLWSTYAARDGWLFSCYPMYAGAIDAARGKTLPASRLALLGALRCHGYVPRDGWHENWAAVLLDERREDETSAHSGVEPRCDLGMTRSIRSRTGRERGRSCGEAAQVDLQRVVRRRIARVLWGEGTRAHTRTAEHRAAQKRIDAWYNIVTNRMAGEAMMRRALSVARAVKREYHPLFRCLAAWRASFGTTPPPHRRRCSGNGVAPTVGDVLRPRCEIRSDYARGAY